MRKIYKKAVIIDVGGDTTKVGFAKDNFPSSTFPTIVGRPVVTHSVTGFIPDYYVGHNVANCNVQITKKRPIERDKEINWDDLECVWYQIFKQHLCINEEEHPILHTEPPLNTKQNREVMTGILFETFNIPALYISQSAVLSLYATGRTTGVVAETGHTVSHTVPILQGCPIPEATHKIDVSGSQLTEYLAKCLTDNNTQGTKIECVRNIKENFVSHEMASHSYELPDGKPISIGNQLLKCTEAIFTPSLLYDVSLPDRPGIHERIQQSISWCDKGAWKHLYGNILLSGGNSLFPGLREKLENKISCLSHIPNRVIAPAERLYLPWIGGAILASLSTFQDKWISMYEYDEMGPTVTTRKPPF